MDSKCPPSLPLWARRRDDPNPPDGWQETPLVAVADIRFSSVDKKSHVSEKPIRLCNYTDVYNKEYVHGHEDFMHATASESEISRFAVEAGDVIITKDSETPDDIGVPAVVLAAPKDLLCGYHLALIRPRSDTVDPVFLAKQVAHTRIRRYYARLANGLTRYGLTNAVVENTPVWLPQPEEQHRAAQVLRGIDEAIVKAEAVIAKLEAIKQGLLHDILTRGLDDNGELREPVHHVELREAISPPMGWREATLASLSDIRFSSVDKKSYSNEKPVRLCNYMDVYNKEYITGHDNFMHATASEAEIARFSIEAGDVIITKDSETPDDVGVPAVVVAAPTRLLCGYHLALIRPHRDNVDPLFLAKQLGHYRVRRYFAKFANGLTRYGLSTAVVKQTPIWLPTLGEQEAIARLLTQHDARLHKEVKYLSKLKAIKKGLMEDLLTGRVPVPAGKVPASATG